MSRILIGGAGGAPANNFIMSLRETGDADHLIGMNAITTDLLLADVDERHVVPYADDPAFADRLNEVIERSRPDLVHSQHDFEIRALSRLRHRLDQAGVRYLMPAAETVELCVDKGRSQVVWKQAGVPVPETILVNDEADLQEAFRAFGGKVWLRATEGGGGKGALPADDFEFARMWISRFDGWGAFTAAEQLTPDTVTFLSIWFEGDLVVAQTRRRRSWNFGDRTLSGVTGITGVGETCSLPDVTDTALAAIAAVDPAPHGIFAVDMTYDEAAVPNVTEINIGRFFTTHYFFTRAGVNFPKIFRDLALHGCKPDLPKKINPLPDGLLWIRGMDVAPVLSDIDALERLEHG